MPVFSPRLQSSEALSVYRLPEANALRYSIWSTSCRRVHLVLYWAVIAFCASLLRNLLGLGSFMAFPGSMVGALCCGLVYKKCHILSLTCLAEAIGTGFLGALAAYPVALYLMGIAPAGLFVYVVPFLISTVAGSILAFILITVLEKGGVMSQIKEA